MRGLTVLKAFVQACPAESINAFMRQGPSDLPRNGSFNARKTSNGHTKAAPGTPYVSRKHFNRMENMARHSVEMST